MALAKSTPLRAFVASRMIVLVAGLAGALLVPRRLTWWTFDPARLTDRLGAVGNVLAAPAVRWDSIHYLAIAQHGYATASSTTFLPLYPMLIRVLGYVLGSDPVAGVAISLAALGVALVLLHRLTELELGRRAADVTALLVAFAPLSVFFSAVYTESLFLALSVGSTYAARRGRWTVACVTGGLAAATRITGVVLVVPLALMYRNERGGVRRGAPWLLAVPAGLIAYLSFAAVRGYGFLAPIAEQGSAQYDRHMSGPLATLVAAAQAAARGAHSLGTQPFYRPSVGGPFSAGAESMLLLGVLALVALREAFRRLPLAYGAYAATTLLVCTWSPIPGQPLRSFDRFTLTIFPLWMAAGAWLSERRVSRPVVLVSAALLAFWTFQFATWAWVA